MFNKGTLEGQASKAGGWPGTQRRNTHRHSKHRVSGAAHRLLGILLHRCVTAVGAGIHGPVLIASDSTSVLASVVQEDRLTALFTSIRGEGTTLTLAPDQTPPSGSR